jgi:hypothetical protein
MHPNNPPATSTDASTDQEEDSWQYLARLAEIQARNRVAMAAWNAAADFLTQNADQLGKLSLREAFEKGFLAGYDCAKMKNV